MEFDDDYDVNSYREEQRVAVRRTIRLIGIEELKAIGETLFPIAGDPWRERYFQFLEDHPGCEFYHAEAVNRVELIYCHETGNAIWYIPGKGIGAVMPKGMAVLKDVVRNL